MTVADILFIRATFNLEPRDLAKALNVSPATVTRWESGENGPTGLQAEVLRALHNVALKVQDDEAQKQMIAGLILLGIGALIFYLLTRPATRCPTAGCCTRSSGTPELARRPPPP